LLPELVAASMFVVCTSSTLKDLHILSSFLTPQSANNQNKPISYSNTQQKICGLRLNGYFNMDKKWLIIHDNLHNILAFIKFTGSDKVLIVNISEKNNVLCRLA
jgi:hypothetical protein